MPLESDRESEFQARETIEALYPESEIRRMCMGLLADSIIHAHQHGQDAWEVTLSPLEKIRLNVGRFFVCTFFSDTISLHLDEASLDADLRAEMITLMPKSKIKNSEELYSLIFRFNNFLIFCLP